MGEVERISLRKIYVGRAALSGLLFGLLLGVVFVLFFMGLFAANAVNPENLGLTSSLPNSNMFYLYVLIFIPIFALSFCFIFALFALIYNVVVAMKGELHLGLAEMDDVKPTV